MGFFDIFGFFDIVLAQKFQVFEIFNQRSEIDFGDVEPSGILILFRKTFDLPRVEFFVEFDIDDFVEKKRIVNKTHKY